MTGRETVEATTSGEIGCKVCGGAIDPLMGCLGNLQWFRCEDCGMEQSIEFDPEEEE